MTFHRVGSNRRRQNGKLIPEGETKCVWMDAGVISYKLCDHDNNCEECPFDFAMRRDASDPLSLEDEKEETKRAQGRPLTKRNLPSFAFEDVSIDHNSYYHRAHTYAMFQSGAALDSASPGAARGEGLKIGVDCFAGNILPRDIFTILPNQGDALKQGHSFCWLLFGTATLPLRAPLSGEVTSINPRIAKEPELLRSDPEGEGWLLILQPGDLELELLKLLRGKRAMEWLSQEKQRFLEKLDLSHQHRHIPGEEDMQFAVGPTMADGGKIIYPERYLRTTVDYLNVIRDFFW